MLDLVGEFMKTLKPNFSRENALIYRGVNTSDTRYVGYYDRKTGEKFAKFFPDYEEIQLETDLFYSLEGIFGEEMTMVIDWFNNEFGEDATTITF